MRGACTPFSLAIASSLSLLFLAGEMNGASNKSLVKSLNMGNIAALERRIRKELEAQGTGGGRWRGHPGTFMLRVIPSSSMHENLRLCVTLVREVFLQASSMTTMAIRTRKARAERM
jgi:hypothetical protein